MKCSHCGNYSVYREKMPAREVCRICGRSKWTEFEMRKGKSDGSEDEGKS